MNNNKQIIAIASGKGGVGKSVLLTNIAAGLAMIGKKVIMVDADFGGSNLHALLNVAPKGKGFKSLISSERAYIKNRESIQKTNIPNLWLVHGWDYLVVYGLNKEKSMNLNKYIDEIKADFVLMDLGPGIGLNTLRLFIKSDIGIVVVTPEITSILNALIFIKYVVIKKISRHIVRHEEMKKLLNRVLSPLMPLTISEMLDEIKKIDLKKWMFLSDLLKNYKPYVIINCVGKDEGGVEKRFSDYLKKNYLLNPIILTCIKESRVVKKSVEKRVPFFIEHPRSRPAENIKIILHKLLYAL